jgi:hypothetical protein
MINAAAEPFRLWLPIVQARLLLSFWAQAIAVRRIRPAVIVRTDVFHEDSSLHYF